MGEMMETFRAEREVAFRSAPANSGLARFAFRELLPHRGRLRVLASVMAAYEAIGLGRAMQAVLRPLAPGLARAHAMRPVPPPRRDRRLPTERARPEGFPAAGERRARVALFLGCLTDEWFADVHRATIRVLQANGCDVVIPDGQTCCGALQRHAGLLDDARGLLARNARAFDAGGFDAVIVNSAGCGASLKEPLDDASPRPAYRDVLEFLVQLGLRPPTRPVERVVTYDPPCHLLHAQRFDRAEELLEQVPGLRIVPLRRRERCCGAGGVYNLTQPGMADAVLADKVENVTATGADTVLTGNPGCALQLARGLHGTGIRVMHPVSLLDLAYGSD
jgi:glycolate oxidase iron-sulfur subunit